MLDGTTGPIASWARRDGPCVMPRRAKLLIALLLGTPGPKPRKRAVAPVFMTGHVGKRSPLLNMAGHEKMCSENSVEPRLIPRPP